MPHEARPSDRCGKTLSKAASHLDVSEMCCWRPVWEDHDRCVWHADVENKPVEALEPMRPRSGEYIDGAILRSATLIEEDWFADCMLVGADFSDADVRDADFSGANLMFATFERTNARYADFSETNVEGAVFRNADLRNATLERTRLDEAVLTEVHINSGTSISDRSVYETGAQTSLPDDSHPLAAAAWEYRERRKIFSLNSLPERSRESYVLEKDARRRLAWDTGNILRAVSYSGSRWLMRYGSSPWRILASSLVIVVLSAFLYPLTGGIQEVGAERAITYTVDDPTAVPTEWLAQVFFKSLYFSVVTFATLGYGDIQPVGTMARVLASVETVIGSLLVALLVFVLARSVTW